MLQLDRPAVQDFDPGELLYMRFPAGAFEDDRLNPDAIKMDQSVNRQRFSDPADVIFDENGRYDAFGVTFFKVEDIPKSVTGDGGTFRSFFAHHCPEQDNYSHAEVRHNGPNQPSKSVRKRFRIGCVYFTTKLQRP